MSGNTFLIRIQNKLIFNFEQSALESNKFMLVKIKTYIKIQSFNYQALPLHIIKSDSRVQKKKSFFDPFHFFSFATVPF